MIKELGWESLENRRIKLRVQMLQLYKIANNMPYPQEQNLPSMIFL